MASNATQILPFIEDIIIEDDVLHLSPNCAPFHVSTLFVDETRPSGDHSDNLREKSQRFKATNEEFFNEELSCFQPCKDTPQVAPSDRD